MFSSIRAILWEQWRITRWVFIGTAIVGFLFHGILSYYQNMEDFGGVLAFMALLGFGGFLLFDFSNGNTIRCGCSTHQWTLPIKRWLYVALYLGYRMAAMALLACLVYWGEWKGWKLLSLEMGGFIVQVVCIQAVAFALMWAAPKRLILPYCILGSILFFFAFMLLYTDYLSLRLSHWQWGWLLFGFVIVCLVLAGVSALTLDKRRIGLWDPIHVLEARFYWPGRFPSSYSAQCWSEWRHHGTNMTRGLLVTLFLVLGYAGIVVLFVGLANATTRSHLGLNSIADLPIMVPLFFALLFPIYAFCPMAFLTSTVPASYDSRMLKSSRSAFVFTLPVKTNELVMARLFTALKSTFAAASVVFLLALGYLLICLGTGIDYSLWPVYTMMTEENLSLIALFICAIGGFVLAWSLYCSPFPFLILALANLMPLFLNAFLGELGVISARLQMELIRYLPSIMSFLVLVGGSIWLGIRAWQNDLLPRKWILFFTGLAPIIMIVPTSLFCVYAKVSIGPNEFGVLLFVGLLAGCVPALTAFFQASWLDWVRHR